MSLQLYPHWKVEIADLFQDKPEISIFMKNVAIEADSKNLNY